MLALTKTRRPAPRRPGMAQLLASCREALAALEAVNRMHRRCGCPLCVESSGMLFHVALYESMLDGEAVGPEKRQAVRRSARMAAGAHGDPVYRVTQALRGLHAAAARLEALHADCPGCELCPWAEGIAYQTDVYHGLWDSVTHGRMSRTAEEDELVLIRKRMVMPLTTRREKPPA